MIEKEVLLKKLQGWKEQHRIIPSRIIKKSQPKNLRTANFIVGWVTLLSKPLITKEHTEKAHIPYYVFVLFCQCLRELEIIDYLYQLNDSYVIDINEDFIENEMGYSSRVLFDMDAYWGRVKVQTI